MRIVEPCTGFEKEFAHFDVGRQFATLEQLDVFKIGVVAEYPCDERLQQASFQLAMPTRRAQRQAGENFQMNAFIAQRPLDECIHQWIGFANTHRQPHDDLRPYSIEGGVDAFA